MVHMHRNPVRIEEFAIQLSNLVPSDALAKTSDDLDLQVISGAVRSLDSDSEERLRMWM